MLPCFSCTADACASFYSHIVKKRKGSIIQCSVYNAVLTTAHERLHAQNDEHIPILDLKMKKEEEMFTSSESTSAIKETKAGDNAGG